jgi:crotonobetainyl-CoA:carnitine CoA-transferase CaiB-like acyl-CoA transferase
LAADPDYDTIRKRSERAGEIVPKIREALKQRTALEWEELFGERVPCSAVRGMDQMFDDPQVLSEALVNRFEHPSVGSYRGFVAPLKFSSAPPPIPSAAPAMGQHTREILIENGYSDEQIADLRRKRVIFA